MELFSELYGCYYQVVREILNRAQNGISKKDMKEISVETAFAESSLYILPKLMDGKWKLLEKKGELYYAKTRHGSPCYLTELQQRFIKSLLADKRIRLFLTDSQLQEANELLKNTEPLFYLHDFRYFDQFKDGDPYEKDSYRKTFRDIHKALCEKKLLDITYKNNTNMESCLPVHLEYSAKDDKFRLHAIKLIKEQPKQQVIFNLSSIKNTCLSDKQIPVPEPKLLLEKQIRWENVKFLIFNERNALERCTLQFSSYEKHIKYRETENCYECTMYYDKADEKEIVIRLLSFGPLIKVTGPDNFVGMIKKRILRQRKLLYHFENNGQTPF